jgi:hypothetical protein
MFLKRCLGELVEYIWGYLNYYNNERIQLELKVPLAKFKQKVSENVLEKWDTRQTRGVL